MRRLALLASLLLAAAGLRAAAGWDQVGLFDWVYPGEPGYQALQDAVRQSGKQGWLPTRIGQGQKLPQASARELAWDLSGDPAVDPATQAKLKELFADEPQQLGFGDAGGSKAKADELTEALNQAGRRMDEIQKIYATNNYSKASTPGVNMDLWGAYRGDVPGGFLQRRNRAFMIGGANFTLNASIDKVNASLSLGVRYWGGDSTSGLYSYEEGLSGVGASFQIPLSNGGLEVHLGEKFQVFLSPLIFGNLFAVGREPFHVEVIDSFRPERVIKVLDLDYPAFTREIHGLEVVRQGQAWYWPFSRTQFIYTPADNDYWQTWNAKIYTTALRLDRDINGNSWMDPGLYYFLAQRSFQDTELIHSYSGLAQSAESYGLGTELHLAGGTQLKLEAAYSRHVIEKSINGPVREDLGTAAIGTLVQPVGPLFVALEAGMAEPRFLTGPQVANRLQTGATLDSMDTIPWPNTDPDGIAWVSYMKDPAILTNNSTRYALKLEWHSAWLGLGLYGGVLSQINPTDGRVVINPVIEGREDNGYGWFKLFGQTYAPPPAPGSSTGPTPGEKAQAQFNFPRDGSARYGPTAATIPVHWQGISQQGYREVYFTAWLTQNGVGDNRLMDPVAKTFNYAGARAVLDFAAMADRLYPSRLILMGEMRDLALNAGLPTLDGANLFSQNYAVATVEHGVNATLTVLGKAAIESWKSRQNFHPLDMQILEWGGGFDLNLSPYVSGLQMNVRGTSMQFDDLNLGARAFTLWTLSVGTTLSY